ncbi:hypothetical protein NQZ68_030511 [Dissostichus eleginoides]|nr:hypothetical protein NQZ68_030511 [Dissostichus eleginoides]
MLPPPSSFHSSPYERSLKGLHLPHPPSSSSPLPDMLRSSQASSGQPSILYLDAGLSVTSVKPPMALTGEERKQIGGGDEEEENQQMEDCCAASFEIKLLHDLVGLISKQTTHAYSSSAPSSPIRSVPHVVFLLESVWLTAPGDASQTPKRIL